MYPQHLIDLAEEAFDIYLSKNPESQQAWEKFVAAVTVYLADINSDTPVQQYVDQITQFVMER